MFKFIKKLLGIKPKNDMPGIEKFLPENFDSACYLLGYVEGKGYRVIELPYKQKRTV